MTRAEIERRFGLIEEKLDLLLGKKKKPKKKPRKKATKKRKVTIGPMCNDHDRGHCGHSRGVGHC